MSEKIWSNEVLGTETFYDFDEAEGDIILTTRQNVEPTTESNKATLNSFGSSPRWGDGKIIASIPIVIMLQLVQQGILSPKFAILDEKRFDQWLNDPENRCFRTFPGKI